jgi:hypothetical protein
MWALREHLHPRCSDFAFGGMRDYHQTNINISKILKRIFAMEKNPKVNKYLLACERSTYRGGAHLKHKVLFQIDLIH